MFPKMFTRLPLKTIHAKKAVHVGRARENEIVRAGLLRRVHLHLSFKHWLLK